MQYRITIDNTEQTFTVSNRFPLLRAMEHAGVAGIPVGCREGGCGICKIAVIAGSYQTDVMSRAHISQAEQQQGVVLACRITPTSDLRIRTLKKMTRLLFKNGSPILTKS